MKFKKFVNVIPPVNGKLELASNEFAILVNSRNDLHKKFGKGYVFGALTFVHKHIPAQLMKSRLDQLETLADKQVWNIFGAPGSGKTYLGHVYLAKKDLPGLHFVLNKTELVKTFVEKAIVMLTEQVFYSSVIEILLDGRFSLLPRESTQNEGAIQTTRSVLRALLAGKEALTIVIDDYYIYREMVEKTLVGIVEKGWNVKFILIGRPNELSDRLKTKVGYLECKGWEREDAALIIDNWLETQKHQTEDIMKIDWLRKENQFSIYLMRLIVNNLENIKNQSLSTILLNELQHSLKPVFEKLIGTDRKGNLSYNELKSLLESTTQLEGSKDEIIDHLKSGLNNATPIDMDRLIESIGELSWASRFQVNTQLSSINAGLISQYLNFLNLEEFKTVAQEANILTFDEGGHSGDWTDNLISDGCVAILLRRRLQRMVDETTSMMKFSGALEGLRKQKSLQVLSLVLDSKAFLQLTKVVASTNFDRMDIVEELASDQMIDRLSRENQVENLLSILNRALLENDEDKHYAKVAKFLKRFAAMDANFKLLLKQKLGHDEAISHVAVYVSASESERNYEFYTTMDSSGVNKYESTKASIDTWKNFNFKLLVTRLNKITNYTDDFKEQIHSLWSSYLLHDTPQHTLDLIEEFVNDENSIETDTNLSILKTSLEQCKNIKENIPAVKLRLAFCIGKTLKTGKYRFCEALCHYYVYFDFRGIFYQTNNWVLNHKDKVAMPVKPYGLSTVGQIMAQFPKSDNYRIASVIQLEQTQGIEFSDKYELVCDYLAGFDIHQKQLPVNYKIVKVENDKLVVTGSLTQNDLMGNEQRKIHWRPVLNIASLLVKSGWKGS